ncbi:MAG: hypothetical protein M0R06_05625 [Sphaerochaeta sp.]|jgi:hypothetical protein|nr:hypothetical protein [Sphaerochaeta sp.]
MDRREFIGGCLGAVATLVSGSCLGPCSGILSVDPGPLKGTGANPYSWGAILARYNNPMANPYREIDVMVEHRQAFLDAPVREV